MDSSKAKLEALLRAKKLGGTLVSMDYGSSELRASTGLDLLDKQLGGGLVRGHISEIVGPISSGRTSLLVNVLAAATSRGEGVALVDTFDSFDPPSSCAAGLDLSRVLWIRGWQSRARTLEQSVNRSIKAAGMTLRAGRFGVVAVDFSQASVDVLQKLPFTTWRRLASAIESTRTVGILVVPALMGRSAGGHSIALGMSFRSTKWLGNGARNYVFQGVDVDAQVVSTRVALHPIRLQTRTNRQPQNMGSRINEE